MKNTYTYHNVSYTHGEAGKWIFTQGSFTLIQYCTGGREVADKVARQVSGSLARTNGEGMDNLGRSRIADLVGSKF